MFLQIELQPGLTMYALAEWELSRRSLTHRYKVSESGVCGQCMCMWYVSNVCVSGVCL